MRKLLFFILIVVMSTTGCLAGSKTFFGSDICDDGGMMRITSMDNFGDVYSGIPATHFVQLGTYDHTTGNWIRELVRFNDYEDSIPSGQTIDSAFYRQYYYAYIAQSGAEASQYAYIYRMKVGWTEGDNSGSLADQGENCWYYRYRPWATADTVCDSCHNAQAVSCDSCWEAGGELADSCWGADCSVCRTLTPTDSSLITATSYGWQRWNVTADVQAHYDDTTNNGWILIKKAEQTANIRWQFYSSEDSSSHPDSIPELIIYYSELPGRGSILRRSRK